jgi:hypothetical protein
VWEVTSYSGGPGMMMWIKSGPTMQQAVDEMSQPNYTMFTQTHLPGYLVMPRNPMYLGVSELSGRGMRDKKAEAEVDPKDLPAPPAKPNVPVRSHKPVSGV